MIALSNSNDLDKLKTEVFHLNCNQKFIRSNKFTESIVTVNVDLSDWQATKSALQSIDKPIDFLVNNAGIIKPEPIGQVTQQSFDLQFAINTRAMINISQMIAELMIRNKTAGAIVNISSQASIKALKDQIVYCASKAAVDSITRGLAFELGPYNIRVNSVNPTVVMTELAQMAWSDPVKANAMKSRIPLGKFAQPEDVANATAFLLSDQSSMITGTNIILDGGFTSC